MSWFTAARNGSKGEERPQLEANSVDETPARAITKLALSRQVGCIERVKAAASLQQGRHGARSDAQRRSQARGQCCRIQWRL